MQLPYSLLLIPLLELEPLVLLSRDLHEWKLTSWWPSSLWSLSNKSLNCKKDVHGFLWFQRPPEITCVCVSRHRTSVSTARKCWSLGRKCPSCSSCLRQMKCALLLVRITHTPHAPASSPFLCRSLNWVSISNFRLKRLIITYVLQLLFPNLFLYLLDHHF